MPNSHMPVHRSVGSVSMQVNVEALSSLGLKWHISQSGPRSVSVCVTLPAQKPIGVEHVEEPIATLIVPEAWGKSWVWGNEGSSKILIIFAEPW